jgi:hypothetical protein
LCWAQKASPRYRSYEDCDVFLSLAKLKEHTTAGITLRMKNFTPCTIYGEDAPADEPGLFAARRAFLFLPLGRRP